MLNQFFTALVMFCLEFIYKKKQKKCMYLCLWIVCFIWISTSAFGINFIWATPFDWFALDSLLFRELIGKHFSLFIAKKDSNVEFKTKFSRFMKTREFWSLGVRVLVALVDVDLAKALFYKVICKHNSHVIVQQIILKIYDIFNKIDFDIFRRIK